MLVQFKPVQQRSVQTGSVLGGARGEEEEEEEAKTTQRVARQPRGVRSSPPGRRDP